MTVKTSLAALLLLLASPALVGSGRCTTSEVKSLGRLQTLCDDGMRAVSTYNRTLNRWDTTVTEWSTAAHRGRGESPRPRPE